MGGEDPLEEEMAAHSSILAWKIPWTEEPGRLQGPCGHKGSDTTEQLITHTHTHFLKTSWVRAVQFSCSVSDSL